MCIYSYIKTITVRIEIRAHSHAYTYIHTYEYLLMFHLCSCVFNSFICMIQIYLSIYIYIYIYICIYKPGVFKGSFCMKVCACVCVCVNFYRRSRFEGSNSCNLIVCFSRLLSFFYQLRKLICRVITMLFSRHFLLEELSNGPRFRYTSG